MNVDRGLGLRGRQLQVGARDPQRGGGASEAREREGIVLTLLGADGIEAT